MNSSTSSMPSPRTKPIFFGMAPTSSGSKVRFSMISSPGRGPVGMIAPCASGRPPAVPAKSLPRWRSASPRRRPSWPAGRSPSWAPISAKPRSRPPARGGIHAVPWSMFLRSGSAATSRPMLPASTGCFGHNSASCASFAVTISSSACRGHGTMWSWCGT